MAAGIEQQRLPPSDSQAGLAPPLVDHGQLHRQLTLLNQLDCLHNVAATELSLLAPLCTLRAFIPGTQILSERVAGSFLYIVLRGTMRLSLRDRHGEETLIGVLGRGDVFGEGPLFGDLFRGASVKAETLCYLLQLPLVQLREITEQIPQTLRSLRSIYRKRLIDRTLARVPLFSQLSPLERAGIAALLQPVSYQRGARILQQGEPGSALYLIETGQVQVERDNQTIAHLDEGDFFGEMSLLSGEPHNANILAITPLELLLLPANAFHRLLERQPTIMAEIQRVAERRKGHSSHLQHHPEHTQQLSLIVGRGMLRGTRLLVRDPALCEAGCTICEHACAERHGQARLQIPGVSFSTFDVVDACRQCQVGAECVEVCPEDAITWNDRGALIITDQCNGCGLCQPACPYNAISIVPTNNSQQQSPLWALWNQLQRLRNPLLPLEPVRPTQRADKCDLCHGYDDLACVRACPTGALRLVPVEELFPL
jgi:CRP-like cAMP-binding protein/Fe-S-cluster-containing hydrogenase component 2